MAKTFKIILSLFLFANFLFASNSQALKKDIDVYSSKINTANTEELRKTLNSLKNIYVKAMLNDDNEVKIESLEAIIKVSKLLDIPYESYEKTLLESKEVSSSPKQNTSLSKITPQKKSSSSSSSQKIPKKSQKKTNNTSKNPPYIKHVDINDNNINIYFTRDIASDDIKFFKLTNNSSNRYVFDIKSNTHRKYFYNHGIGSLESVEIAQNDLNKVRVVLTSKNQTTTNYDFRKDKLTISFGLDSKSKNKAYASITPIPYFVAPPKKLIVIDPGHGGKDPGAVGNKEYEKNVVLSISRKLEKILKERGYKVSLTRTNDIFIPLRERTKIANDKNADLFLSIHANSAPKSKADEMNGVEVFFLSPTRSERSMRVAAMENEIDTQDMNYFFKSTFLSFLNKRKIVISNRLAIDIQNGILSSIRENYKTKDGGVREGLFWVLVGAQMPAVLIETGYISNSKEREKLKSNRYQELLAEGIANGVDNFFIKNG